jgi:hypothetical protein
VSPRLAQVLARLALASAVCVAVASGGVAARDLLTEEASQAHAFVEEGRQALAHYDRGRAVLALERARLLAPRDATVRSALAALDAKDVEPLAERTLRLVTSREWFSLALASGWIAGLGVALIVVRRGRRRGLAWATLAAGGALLGAATGMVCSADPLAIVCGPEAALLVAPYPSASSEQALSAGSMVTVGSAYDEFVHVEGADGMKGWARRGSLERIASPED